MIIAKSPKFIGNLVSVPAPAPEHLPLESSFPAAIAALSPGPFRNSHQEVVPAKTVKTKTAPKIIKTLCISNLS